MGRDKALVPKDGRLLLARSATALVYARDVRELVVACGSLDRAAGYAKALAPLHLPVPLRFVPDETPGLGPVAGLAAGLAAATAEYVAVAPVDAPNLEPALVERLFERASGRDGAVYVHEGRAEALSAVYRAPAAAARFREALRAGERAAHRALRGLDLARIDAPAASSAHFRDADEPRDI